MNFKERYNEYLTAAEQAIAEHAAAMRYDPPVLGESMRYSLLAGGKRIRPVLFYATLHALGADYLREKDLAAAIECIHTYSLIHDDLPAMDNDDFRRGKPSNHKVFGEANAILAGDALLSLAFDLMLRASARDGAHLRAAQKLSAAAGAEGMIAGQSADLLLTHGHGGERELFFLYEKKTGLLLSAPLEMAAAIAGGDEEAAASFGRDLGILFQLTDDLLDVKGNGDVLGKTPGKDEKEEKLTCIRVFGEERAERLADEYEERCFEKLKSFLPQGDFFEGLVSFVRKRDR